MVDWFDSALEAQLESSPAPQWSNPRGGSVGELFRAAAVGGRVRGSTTVGDDAIGASVGFAIGAAVGAATTVGGTVRDGGVLVVGGSVSVGGSVGVTESAEEDVGGGITVGRRDGMCWFKCCRRRHCRMSRR
jgi:hypothetical protein